MGEGKEKKKDCFKKNHEERRQEKMSRTHAVAVIPALRMGKLSLRQVRYQWPDVCLSQQLLARNQLCHSGRGGRNGGEGPTEVGGVVPLGATPAGAETDKAEDR